MSTLNVSTRAQIVRFHQFFCSILLLVPEATYILTAFYIDIQRCWLNLWWINFLYFHSMFGFTWFKPTTKAWNSSQHLSASDECHQRHRPSTQPPHQEMGRSNETWRNLTFDIGTHRNRRLQYVMFLCQLTFILLAFGKLHSEKDMWIDSVQMDFRTRLIFSSKAFRGLLPLDRISNRAPLATK